MSYLQIRRQSRHAKAGTSQRFKGFSGTNNFTLMTARQMILQCSGYVGKLLSKPAIRTELTTCFKFAIRSGNPEVVRLLLENGADPNLTFGNFETCVSASRTFYMHLTKLQKPFGQCLPYRQRRHNPPSAGCWR